MTKKPTHSLWLTSPLRLVYRWVSRVFLVLFITLLTAIGVLIFSSNLPNHLWPYLADWSDQKIKIERSEGSVFTGLTLYNVKYNSQELQVLGEEITWSWLPLTWSINDYRLNGLSIRGMQLNLPQSSPQERSPSFELNQLFTHLQQPFSFTKHLGFDLAIEQLSLTDFEIKQADESIFYVDQLNTRLRWQANQLEIPELYGQITWQHQTHQAWFSTRVFFKDSDWFEGDLKLSYSGLNDISPILLDMQWEGQLTKLNLDVNTQTPVKNRSQHELTITPELLSVRNHWSEFDGAWPNTGTLNLNDSYIMISHLFEKDETRLESHLNGQFNGGVKTLLDMNATFMQHHLNASLNIDLAHLGKAAIKTQTHWDNNNSTLDWLNPKDVSIALTADQLDLTAFNTELDYRIDADLNLKIEDMLQRVTQLKINQLAVKGQNLPIALSGTIDSQLNTQGHYQIAAKLDDIIIEDKHAEATALLELSKDFNKIAIQQLQLTQADNLLNLSGNLDQNHYQLQVQGVFDQLSVFFSPWGVAGEAEFELQTQGILNQDFRGFDQAQLALKLTSEQLIIDDINLEHITLELDVPLHKPEWGDISIHFTKAAQGENTLAAPFSLKRYLHQTEILTEFSLNHPNALIEFALSEKKPSLDLINIDIQRLKIEQPETGVWILNHPTILRWSPSEQLKLDSGCLSLVSSPSSQICLQGDDHQLNWSLRQFPILDWIGKVIPDNIELDTQLNGQGSINWQQSIRLKQQFYFDQLDILVTEQGFKWPVSIHQWLTEIDWSPEQAAITTRARINETGQLSSVVNLFADQGWGNAEIDGSIRLQLNEWSLSERITQQLNLKRTQLDLLTQVMGSVKDIQHNTRALVDLDFDLALLDLNDQNLTLQAHVENEAISAFGRLTQPDGKQANINLDVPLQTTNPEIKLTLNSDSIKVLKTPFAELFLGADIQLNLDQNGAKLTGSTEVHNSNLNLDKMPLHKRTTLSSDEIIIDSKGGVVNEKESSFPIDYKIDIRLGKNVRLDVQDSRAFLGGQLTLTQTAQATEPSAEGQVTIERGYVQLDRRNRIQIAPSSFNFTGNISNPYLNVNLFRVVDRSTAHLNIAGNATQPQFVFYSTPPQSQARIINLLIFGRAGDLENEPNYQSQLLTAFYRLGIQNNIPAFNRLTRALGVEDLYFEVEGQQVSNLLLGRALSDNLYLRYIHDMSGKQDNAVQIIYQLTPKWSLRSDNRDDRSSIDFIFQRERK